MNEELLNMLKPGTQYFIAISSVYAVEGEYFPKILREPVYRFDSREEAAAACEELRRRGIDISSIDENPGIPWEKIKVETIIVTRHAGTIEWLKSHGIEGEVISHVSDPVQIVGKRVYGTLPLHLAAQAAEVVTIDMPRLPADRRGQDLTPEEMDRFGARMNVYEIKYRGRS